MLKNGAIILKCDTEDCYCRDEDGNCSLTCVTLGKNGQCNDYELFKRNGKLETFDYGFNKKGVY